MNCNIFGFYIENDKDGRLSELLKSAIEVQDERQYVAERINNGKLQSWAIKKGVIKSPDELWSMNGNSFKKLAVDYMNVIRPSVTRVTMKRQNQSIGNFTSNQARTDALVYTGSLVSRYYYNSLSSNSELKYTDKVQLLNDVRKEIMNEFNRRARVFLQQAKANNELEEVITEFNKLNNELKAATEEKIHPKRKREKIADLKKKRFELLYDAIIKNVKNNNALINYAELARNCEQTNGFNQWFTEVKSLTSMFTLSRELDKVKIEKRDTYDVKDVEDVSSTGEDDYMDTINAQTASWDDARLRDYTKHFDGRLKLYLSLIPERSASIVGENSDTNYKYNDNLGVPVYMDVNYVMNQIIAMGPFYSVQHFFDTLSAKANTIESLYGLGQLVNDMRNDMRFANFVFGNFSKPIITTVQIQIGEQLTSPVIANPEAFADSKSTSDLLGDSNMVGREEYNVNDGATLNSLLNNIPRKETLNNLSDKGRNYIKEKVSNYVHKHFPSVNIEKFQDYFFDNPNSANPDQLKALIQQLIAYNTGLGLMLDNIAQYNKEWFQRVNKYNKAVEAYDGFGSYPEKPIYDESSINKRARNDAVINLSKVLNPVLNNFIRLNATNAEGKMSSSMIKNSYLTNFIKQLKLDLDNGNTGQNVIKEFFTRKAFDVCDVETNMFLFGLKDRNGKTIRRGLFTKAINGEYILDRNSDVARMFGLGLFDGARKESDQMGVVYSDMTREDYLLSSIQLANTGLTYEGMTSQQVKGYGNFLMRIPSDASNTYMIQMKKFNTGNIFDWTGAQPIISENISNKLTQLEEFFDDTKIPKSIKDDFIKQTNKYVKNPSSIKVTNSLSANAMMDLLFNGMEGFNIKDYYKIKDKNNVYVPFVYNQDESPFIVWVKGSLIENGQYADNIEIVSVLSLEEYKSDSAFGDLSALNIFDNENELIETTSIRNIISSFLENNREFVTNRLYEQGTIKRVYNRNSEIFLAFRNELWGELQNFATQLNVVFEKDENGNFISKTDTTNLFDVLHYNKSIVKDGKLTGQEFLFKKLFDVGFDANSAILKLLGIYDKEGSVFNSSLFTVTKDGRLQINLRENDIFRLVDANGKKGIITVGKDFDLAMNQAVSNGIDEIISEWLDTYINYINNARENFSTILSAASNIDFTDYMLNTTLAYMMYDNIFEGSSKYYKDAKTFLKRAKETQMGGTAYGAFDFNKYIGTNLETVKDLNGQDAVISIQNASGKELIDTIPTFTGNGISQEKFVLKTGFRAITVKNSFTTYSEAQKVWDTVYKSALKGVSDEQAAKKIADRIASGYGRDSENDEGQKTKANDAQSYITIEEFIRRRYADGTLDEYIPLLRQLLDDDIKVGDIDFSAVTKKIQAQKNVYYDLQYDSITGKHYPRQIKNAEFVLIPKLLPEGSSLRTLYDMMKANDIGQVNTLETSKAANKNVLTYWDNKGIAHPDLLQSSLTGDNIENYYYKYLYKQQDIVDHIGDTANKAGIQLFKKVMDNSSTYGDKVKNASNNIQSAFASNIRDSYNKLIRELGWKTDKNGNIVNKDGSPGLRFDDFYRKCLEEFQRTGTDSNIVDYLTPDKTGVPIMPEWMSVVSTKLENIAQSVFNNNITRQLLPGYHASQVTNVGYSDDLKYHPVKEDGTQSAIVEVRLPAYHPAIKELVKKYGKDVALKKLQEAGLDTHLAYRIPTEGKQSIAVFKIVEILDESYGSTIIVPNEWVTQTGSDFDIDSIYSLIHELYFDGENIHKVEYNIENTEEGVDERFKYVVGERVQNNGKLLTAYNNAININDFDALIQIGKKVGLDYEEFSNFPIMDQLTREQRNNVIVDNMIEIMSDEAVMEEVFGRSNFDDITDAKDNLEKLSGNTLKNASVYNPIDQLKFMQNAIDGRKLKAFSVNRDTFCSICNRVQASLSEENGIRVIYDRKYYNEDILKSAYEIEESKDNLVFINHRNFGWSKNNRNVAGRLVTSYSSETTAHILDAIKEGALINETEYTFGTFKTLVDLGIDYDTAVAWLMQPAITRINNINNSTNSVYLNDNTDATVRAIKELAVELGFADSIFTPYTKIIETLKNSKEYNNILKNIFYVKDGKTAINRVELENRLEREKKYKENNQTPSREDLMFDLVTTFQFKEYKELTDKIENIAQVLRPDAFGAKQIIRDTRSITEKVEKYKTGLGKILMVQDGRNIINAIYTEENSLYEYLNAFYKYSTTASVRINSRLFDTENGRFLNLTKEIETRIGRTLTDDEYQAAKKYLVHSVYNAIPLLYNPVELDKSKFAIVDKKTIEQEASLPYWETEMGRVYGLREDVENNPAIEDINNPTDEELDKYKKLTPAQKVLFIKSHFTDINYFDKLDVVKAFRNEITTKKYSYNRIYVADTTFNIDTLRQEFLNAYLSKNVFVRLAAIDLVKYSFIVEGFDFRKSSISKTIPNVVLYTNVEQGGMGIVDEAKFGFQNLDIPDYQTQYYTDNFVRSHSYVIKTKTIKSKKDNKVNPIHTKLKECYDKSNGLIVIPKTENYSDLLTEVGLCDKTSNYVKLDHSAGNRKQTVLYKLIDDVYLDKVYLVPINYLEEFENSTWSVNNANNQWFSYDYYMSIVGEHMLRNMDIFTIETEDNTNSKLVPKDEKPEVTNALLEERDNILAEMMGRKQTIPTYKFTSHPDEYKLINTYKNGTPAQQAQLEKFFGDIIEAITDIHTDLKVTLVKNSSDAINSLLTLSDTQPRKAFYIPYEDTTVKVSIQRYNGSLIKKYQTEGLKKNQITKEIQFYSAKYPGLNATDRFYNIEIEAAPDVKEIIEEGDKRDSKYVSYDAGYSNASFTGEENHTLAVLIAKDLKFQARKDDAEAAHTLARFSLNGINASSPINLNNRKTSVYTIANRYYKQAYNSLIAEMNNFTLSDGNAYKISDPELYKHLQPDDAARLIALILKAQSFGESLREFTDFDVTGEDDETQKEVELLKGYVNSVRNSNLLKSAFDNIFNIYISNAYSTNPHIKVGLIDATTLFGDTSAIVANISDIGHLPHKQIQMIVKAIGEQLAASEYTAREKVEDFDKWIKDNIGDNPNEVFNKIIDDDGRIIQPFTDKFLEDKIKLKDELKSIEQTYGAGSKEFFLKKLEYDKFLYKNTEQLIVPDYYKRHIELREYVYKKAGERFIKYNSIRTELNTLYRDSYTLTPEEQNRRQLLVDGMYALLEKETPDGKMKPASELNEIEAIEYYRDNMTKLNDEYFVYSESERFKENLNYNLSIIKNYDEKHSSETLSQKLHNVEYKIAYNWIKSNTRYRLNKEAQDALTKAYKDLNLGPVQRSNQAGIRQIYAVHRNDGTLYDIYGQVIGTNFTADEVKTIHDIEQQKYSPVEGDIAQLHSDGALIKNIPQTPILTQDFWIKHYISDEEKSPELVKRKREIFTAINKIISKGINKDKYSQNRGVVEARRLFDNCTQEELEELINLYYELRVLTSGRKEKKKAKLFEFKYNETEFAKQQALYKTFTPTEKNLFQQIFCETDVTGALVTDDDGKAVPNSFIYGYAELRPDVAKTHHEFFDKKRQAAFDLINQNIEFVPTEYYYQSQNTNAAEAQKLYDDAIAAGKSEKEAAHLRDSHMDSWFDANHIWNQRTNQWQPLLIWTTRRIKEGGNLPGTFGFEPIGDNFERDIKEDKKNPNYNDFGNNYKPSTGSYNNSKYSKVLSDTNSKEYKLWSYITCLMNQAATNNGNRRFIEQGFAPRQYKANTDLEWYVKQGLSAFGINFRNYNNKTWMENVDYAHDKDVRNPMLDILKTKGYESMERIPKQEVGQSDEDYKTVVDEITKRNREREKTNLELEKAVRDDDWNTVFRNFVYKSTIYNAREKAKNLAYITIEDLKSRKAYSVNKLGRLSKTSLSTESAPDYNMVDQTRSLGIFQNWTRRVLFGEYKEISKLNVVADTLQNMASAKYMMYNLYAGVNNVTVGLSNILGETFAKTYFDNSQFLDACAEYRNSMMYFIKDMLSDTSNNLTCAILKRFDVVELDRMLDFQGTDDFDPTKFVSVVNTLNYSMQSGGEHFMQNTALIAMLKSHRIYTDNDGKRVIGSFAEYTQNIEDAALKRVLSGNEYLASKYAVMKQKSKADKQLQYEYDKLKRDVIVDFFNTLTKEEKRQYGEEYIKLRNEMLKNDREEFDKLQTVWDQFELVNGVARFKPESGLTASDFGFMKKRAEYVNKKIHGVYDKNGAAQLEKHWYGSLVMQFKKHVFPGIMKRWRTEGYFNEIRGSYEKGSYISVADFLSMEFKDFKTKLNTKTDDGTATALAAIQTTIQCIYDTAANFKFNFELLPKWEQDNIMRATADLCSTMSALLTSFAVYAMADEDDLKNNTFLNSTIYLADRLYGESRMYTPWGAVPEIQTQWRQPVAGQGVFKDLYDASSYVVQWLFDPDYDPIYRTGTYKGQNKVKVKVLKNIPAVRTIQRIRTINSSNKYYRIGDNQTAQKLVKNLAFEVSGKND